MKRVDRGKKQFGRGFEPAAKLREAASFERRFSLACRSTQHELLMSTSNSDLAALPKYGENISFGLVLRR
jgi:hypothetical protein